MNIKTNNHLLTNEELLLEQAYKHGWFKVIRRSIWVIINEKEKLYHTKDGHMMVGCGVAVMKDPLDSRFYIICSHQYLSLFTPTNIKSGQFIKYQPVQTSPIWAARVNHDFTLITDVGEVRGAKGDYIIMNEDSYSLSHLKPAQFNATYQRDVSNDDLHNILLSATVIN